MPRDPYMKRLYGEKLSTNQATALFYADGFESIADVDGYIKGFPSGPGGGENDVPYVWGGLYIQLPCEISEVGPRQFRITATFAPRGAESVAPAGGNATNQETAPDHGDGGANTPVGPELSWSSSGGSMLRTQAIKVISTKTRNNAITPIDYGGAIAVDKDGKVEGVTIHRNTVRWSLKITIPAAAVTGEWIKRLEDMCSDPEGCPVNSEPFFGYAAGEVLFEGITDLATGGASSDWTAHFHFAVQRNRQVVTVYENQAKNDLIRFVDVQGWDYIWTRYKKILDQTTGLGFTVPEQSTLVQVYPRKDFRLLNLHVRRKKTTAPVGP
jgi:hypothetical protein